MPKTPSEELDLRFQWSLVNRIRQAANACKAAPMDAGSAALQSYMSALESLAEYVAAKCQESPIPIEYPLRSQRMRVKRHGPDTVRPKTDRRIIPFPTPPDRPGASPQPAA